MTFWLNGEWREDAAAIRIDDRGLLLGDGVFETILVRNGVPAFLGRHLHRLQRGLQLLSIDAAIPGDLNHIILRLAERNDALKCDAVLRLTVSRGAGERGLGYPENAQPTILMTLSPVKSVPATTRRLVLSNRIRMVTELTRVCKTPAYLENILAYNDAHAAGADDALMLTAEGKVACATTANIFVINDDGVVLTPPASDGALPGVVRGVLLEKTPAAGVTLQESSLSIEDIGRGAVFLTNSLIGLAPAAYQGSLETSGHEIFKRLVSCYQEALAEDLRQAGEA